MVILGQEQTFRQQVRQHTRVNTIIPMCASSSTTLDTLPLYSRTRAETIIANFSLDNFVGVYVALHSWGN